LELNIIDKLDQLLEGKVEANHIIDLVDSLEDTTAMQVFEPHSFAEAVSSLIKSWAVGELD